MIPKKIHCIWFGEKALPPLEKKCIETWRKFLPDYEMVFWNEENYTNSNPVFQKALKNKKWAFCSDVARLDILYKHGGVYLDTDIELIRNLDNFLHYKLFIGKESEKYLNGAIIGSVPGLPFIKESLDEVIAAMKSDFIPIPKIMTYVYEKNYSHDNEIAIFEPEYFYPYNPFVSEIKVLFFNDITSNTHAIHHWNYSWKPGITERIINKIKRTIKGNKFLN